MSSDVGCGYSNVLRELGFGNLWYVPPCTSTELRVDIIGKPLVTWCKWPYSEINMLYDVLALPDLP